MGGAGGHGIPEILMTGLLRCPETRQPLEPALRDLVGRLLALREAGSLRTRSGLVPEPFEDALVTLDGARTYPIRDGIPVLLADESF